MIKQKLSRKVNLFGNISLDFLILNEEDSFKLLGRSTPLARGAFFDLHIHNNCFYLVSKIQKEEIGRDSFWKQRNELLEMLNRGGYNCNSDDLIEWVKKSCLVAIGRPYDLPHYYGALIRSSHKKFVMGIKEHMAGKTYQPHENKLGTAGYSHINLFSWIYYQELKAIQKVAGGRKIDILEVGSSFGNSIFSKKAVQEECGIDASYYGMDISPELIESSLRYTRDESLKNVQFHQGDASNLGASINYFNKSSFDVITSSHLLEHIEDNPKKSISDWLRLANSALIVSVPFDCKSSSCISDHKSHFDRESLLELSDYFQSPQRVIDTSQVDSGILIFYQNGGRRK
jgi:SAM-dependent methyltransferase